MTNNAPSPQDSTRTGTDSDATTARGQAGPRSKPGQSSGERMTHGLVALSSAVVLGIYAAGYMRTQAAAERFALETEFRRPANPLGAGSADSSSRSAAANVTAEESPIEAAPPPATAPARVAALDQPESPATPPAERAAPPPVTTTAPAALPAAAAAPATAPAPAQAPPAGSSAAADRPAAIDVPSSAALPDATAAAVPAQPAAPSAPRYKDGSYLGWGTSRHGDMAVTVVVESGRITSAKITDCQTRWPCTWVEALPGQVVARQSAETDYVSGATQSTNAFYYAVVEALGKATVK